MKKDQFHDELKKLMDEFVHFVYDITLLFPMAERLGKMIWGTMSKL